MEARQLKVNNLVKLGPILLDQYRVSRLAEELKQRFFVPHELFVGLHCWPPPFQYLCIERVAFIHCKSPVRVNRSGTPILEPEPERLPRLTVKLDHRGEP